MFRAGQDRYLWCMPLVPGRGRCRCRWRHGCVGGEQDAEPMTHHQVGAIRAIVLLVLAAMLIACSGCSSNSPYGDAADTERGVCASEGQPANRSLSHGGYITRCGLP